jgi:thiol-disulfide isomerase/thioredoxin
MTRVLLVCMLTLQLAGCGNGLEYADGTKTSFEDWKGRWVLVNYWAEWCAPCRDEIPELNALARAHGDRLLVVGVNFDDVKGVALSDLIVRMGIEFPVLTADPRLRWQYDRPSVLPTTVVIDPAGNVVRTLVGPQTRSTLARILDLQDAE